MPSRPHDSTVAALLADVRCLARRDGLAAALRTVASGIADTFYSRDDLLVLLKRLDAIAPISFDPELGIEDLDPRWLPKLSELNCAKCDTRADRRFAANLERRYQAFVAHDRGSAGGYYWWLDGGAEPHSHLARLGIELREGDAYGFDFFLAERYRGDGRAVEFLHHVETRLRERGYERLWGYVSSANTPARWLYSMRGYEVVRSVHLRPGSMRYRGDFLADDPYAEWAFTEREYLRGLASKALVASAQTALADGRLELAAKRLLRLAQLEPFDSQVHQMLIEVCRRRGRRTEAVRHYSALRLRLARAVGETPDFNLANVAADIAAGSR